MARALIAGALLGAGVVTGGMLMQSGTHAEARANPGSQRLLDEVMARIARDYIDTVSVDQLFRNAASGFVKEIEDPYSALLTPERFNRLKETTSGRYAGIGLELDLRDGDVTVIAPIAGTPADSAGIVPGDRIIGIDGRSVYGLSMEEVQQRMRGPAGTKIRVTLDREPTPPTLTLTRRQIVYRPVQRTEILDGNVGYIALRAFSQTAANEVRAAVESLRQRGARSLILDVRSNPGGLLEEGIGVAELFLDQGQTIVSTRGRAANADQEFEDQARQPWPTMPLVVLIDSGSASASEIVAGAIQDHKRGVVVGTRSYGKGSAQTVYTLGTGHALKLTTARWYTPKGRSIEGDSLTAGIAPDVEVKASTTPPQPAQPSRLERELASDPFVRRGIEVLRRGR